jgi:hypothetical protein
MIFHRSERPRRKEIGDRGPNGLHTAEEAERFQSHPPGQEHEPAHGRNAEYRHQASFIENEDKARRRRPLR